LLAEASGDAIFVLDRELVYEYVNPVAARMLGRDPDEVIGHEWSEFLPVDQYPEQHETIRGVLESGQAVAVENRVQMPVQGRDVWLSTSLTPIMDEQGAVKSLMGVARDITSQKEAEAVLVESEKKYRMLTEAAQDFIFNIDASGTVTYVNEHGAKMFGVTPAEITGRKMEDLFPPEIAERQGNNVRSVIEAGMPLYAENYVVMPMGDMWLGTLLAPIRGEDGCVTGALGISRNITAKKQLESELTAERDRTREYLEIAPALIMVLNRDATVRIINQKGCQVLGCQATEVIGKDWFEGFTPASAREAARRDFNRLISGETGVLERYEGTVIDSGGRERIIAWNSKVMRDEGGEITGVLSSGEDVTERRAAEDMLRESEKRFKALFDTAITGILVADIEQKKFVLGNDTICEMLGYTHDEITRLGVADIHPREALPHVFEQFEQQARGELKVARDLPVRRKDGSVFYADISSGPVVLSGQAYLLGYFSDATDRHQAEAALFESEEKYRSLFEESNDVIFFCTPEGRLLDINPSGVRLFGFGSRQEMIGIDLPGELFQDPGEFRECSERLERGGDLRDQELKLRRKEGGDVTVSLSANVVRDGSGRATTFRGIMRDITGQRKLERQLIHSQKMESIGNLAGGVAHDFNNYLTAIQGYADLAMLEHPEKGALREFIKEIRTSSARAADLTRQLLLFGRREEVNLRPVDLSETISSLQKMLARLIGERYTIATRIAGNLDMIMADRGLIEQVIVNLVVNSRDAMPDGGEIVLEAFNERGDSESDSTPGHGFVHLRVIDNGMGIDSETLSHIFEPFFTTKDVGKGTGLGLSVVYGIVTQHGGVIEVESEAGRGTTFDIRLPVADIDDEETDLSADIIAARGYQGLKVLLIEDDDPVRNLACRILGESGFEVTAAASSSEAQDIFLDRKGDFDIVFSDVVLPDDNGLALAERLREAKPGLRIVLASGYTGDSLDSARIEERGFTFIQKPYSMAQLVRLVGSSYHK